MNDNPYCVPIVATVEWWAETPVHVMIDFKVPALPIDHTVLQSGEFGIPEGVDENVWSIYATSRTLALFPSIQPKELRIRIRKL